jgi:hypothetical protein
MTYRHSLRSRAVLTSLVPVICPPEAVPLAGAIVDHLELTFGATPPLLQKALPAGLAAYDLGALPRYFRRAHALPLEKAEAYFQSWERGITPLHTQFARALNQLMSLACYEQPEMMEAVGYHVAPWIEKVTKKRLTVYADDVRRQEAQILAPDPLRPAAKSKKEVA